MTDQPWYQSSLPASGTQSLLLCNADLDSAEAILRRAKLIHAGYCKNELCLISWPWQIAIKQYDFLLNGEEPCRLYTEGIQMLRNRPHRPTCQVDQRNAASRTGLHRLQASDR